MTQIAYRPEIDGLRAIAVLSVVLFHAGIGPTAGFAGVDVFFVISGYLITALLLKEWTTTGRIDLFGFYARRFRRIFPALIVVIAGTITASAYLLSPFGEQHRVMQSAAVSLVFAANFFFQATTGGYFDGNSDLLPLLHLWSLAVEEQFYLLWPLALIALLRRPKSLAPAIASLCVVSLVLAEALIRNDPVAAFYQMPARFWELAIGGLIASRPSGRLSNGRLAATLGVISVLAGVIAPTAHFPGLGALPAAAGAGLVLYAVHGSSRLGFTGALLSSRPMTFVGLISYSLYLWHWPLLAIDRATRIGPSPLSTRIELILAAAMLAWLSYQFVETPFRRADPKISNRKLVAAGLLISGSLAFFVMTLGNILNAVEIHPRARTAAEIFAERTRRDVPANMDRCQYQILESLSKFPKPNCTSASDKPVRVAIWGDSYAMAWEPLAWALAKEEGTAAISYSRPGCPPALGLMIQSRLPKPGELCLGFNNLVAEKIKDVDVLIMAAHWEIYGVPNPAVASDFKSKFTSTVKEILPHVNRVILLGPTPVLKEDVSRCIEQSQIDACAISRRDFDVRAATSRELLIPITAASQKIEYVELEDFFCTAEICPVLKEGYSLYADTLHVSSTAALKFSETYLASKHHQKSK